MHRFRWTTRRAMAAVAALGLALGLGVPAARVALDRGENHYHLWVAYDTTPPGPGWTVPPEGLPGLAFDILPPGPFWPRYWHRLGGRPWPGPGGCGMSGRRLDEACMLDVDDATPGRHRPDHRWVFEARNSAAPNPPPPPPFQTPDGVSF